jgi:hypothetical protein
VSAGAIIEEATGEMKVKQDTTNVATHFLRMDQFLGFEGSVGEDHVTCRSCWLVLLLGVLGDVAVHTRFGSLDDSCCSSSASVNSSDGGVCVSKSELVLLTGFSSSRPGLSYSLPLR